MAKEFSRLVRSEANAHAAKKLSVTIYPEALSSDYLTVSDALNQVLDLVDALERTESTSAGERQVVWRLTEAYTNSPPFTVVAQPFPAHPNLSISLEANRVATLFASEFRALLNGTPSELVAVDAQAPILRVLERNLNGVGRTEIQIGEDDPICVVPQAARIAKLAIGQTEIGVEVAKPDWQRTEFGTVEGEISGLTRWNGKPALDIIERLSEKRFTCVLNEELSAKIGPVHQWSEVWEGRRINVTGAMHYNSDGDLRRADIDNLEEIEWTDVPLSDLREVDILNGRTLAEYLSLVRNPPDG